MKTREIFSILVLMLGFMAAMMPNKSNDSGKWTKKELINEILSDANYVTPDELAHLLISGDPSIQLVDIRSASGFNKPIRGAINIPMDSAFSENYEFLFDQTVRKNVIYGDNNELAQRIWMATKEKGYTNNYLLKGGLKAWNEDILDPQHPGQTAPQEAIDLYEKRLAARMYFTGAKALPKTDFKIILPAGGRKKKRVEGGCS